MINVKYTCDGCGAVKPERAAWLGLRQNKDCSQIYLRMEVRAFDDCGPDDQHYCSYKCAAPVLDMFANHLIQQIENVMADRISEVD
jgi:hypothetical protein